MRVAKLTLSNAVIIRLAGGVFGGRDEDAAEVVLVERDQHHDGDAEAHPRRLHADLKHLLGINIRL